MAHFAQLNENNVVMQVIAVHNNELLTEDGKENELLGIAFCQSIFGANTAWVQTSYNGNFRKNYAGIGYTYDHEFDAFIPPKPFLNWVLNKNTCQWQAPVPQPDDGKFYRWDEPTVSWVEVVL